jgi:hypothetical protein
MMMMMMMMMMTMMMATMMMMMMMMMTMMMMMMTMMGVLSRQVHEDDVPQHLVVDGLRLLATGVQGGRQPQDHRTELLQVPSVTDPQLLYAAPGHLLRTISARRAMIRRSPARTTPRIVYL